MLTTEQKQKYLHELKEFIQQKASLLAQLNFLEEKDKEKRDDLEQKIEQARPRIERAADITCPTCEGYSMLYTGDSSATHMVYECGICEYRTTLSE